MKKYLSQPAVVVVLFVVDSLLSRVGIGCESGDHREAPRPIAESKP